MIDKPFTQAEKAAILAEDRRNSTMLGRSQLDLLELGGRYKRQSQIVGATGAPEYPAASGWTQDQVPTEPVLGYEINAQEPAGEIHEIQASIERSHASTSLPSTTERDDSASVVPIPDDTVRTADGDAAQDAASSSSAPTKPPTVYRRPIR